MNLFVLRTWLQAKFGKDEAGASMVEYILLVALIALAVIAAVVFLKDQVNGKFNDAGSKLSSSGAERRPQESAGSRSDPQVRRGSRRWSYRYNTNPGRAARISEGAIHMNLFVTRTWLEAKFAKDERGASMVEYILLVALIALAVIAAVVFLKNQVNSKFNDAGSKLSSSGS